MSSLPPLPTFPLHEQSANFAANRPPPLTLHSPPETPSNARSRYSTLPTPFPNSPTQRQHFSNSPVSPQSSENGSSGFPASVNSEALNSTRPPAPSPSTMDPLERTNTVSYPAVPQSTTPAPVPAQAPASPRSPRGNVPPVPALPPFVPAFQPQTRQQLPPVNTTLPGLPQLPQQQTNGQHSSPQARSPSSQPHSPMSLRNAGHPEGEIRTQTVEFAFELAADPSPPQSGHLQQQSPGQTQTTQLNMQFLDDPDRDRRLSYITTPPGSPPVPQTPHTPMAYTAEEPAPPQHPELPQIYTNYEGFHQPPPIPAPIYVPPAPSQQLKYPSTTSKPKRISTSSSAKHSHYDSSTYAHGLFLSCLLHPLIALWACISPCTLHTSTQRIVKPDGSRNGFCGSLLFLPIYPFATLWRRMEIREKYGLRGGGCGEILAAVCMCWCLVVQDYTEVTRRERARGRARDLEMGGYGQGR